MGTFSSFVYGQVCDWLPTFDEKNDQFVEMSRSKERIIKELKKHMKNLVEKMDEDTNKLIAEINAVKVKLVSFEVIAHLLRHIGGHSSRFLLCTLLIFVGTKI